MKEIAIQMNTSFYSMNKKIYSQQKYLYEVPHIVCVLDERAPKGFQLFIEITAKNISTSESNKTYYCTNLIISLIFCL